MASSSSSTSTSVRDERVGWIGLGNMGRGMVKNIVRKANLSKDVLVYNRTTSRTEALVKELTRQEGESQGKGGIRQSESIRELVAQSDIVFMCLGEDDAVLDTVRSIVADSKSGSDSVKGKTFIDCSTVHPDCTAEEERIFHDAGAVFVAGPVFGAPAMAESGQLICVFAGKKDGVDRVVTFGEGVMGRMNIVYADVPASRATLLKVIGNTFIVSMVTTLSEGHVLAEKSGLGTRELHRFVEALFPGPFTAYSNRLLTGDYYQREEPLFAVDLARKDARHAKKVASDAGMTMGIVELADGLLSQVKEEMGEKGDITGIYGAKRKTSGLDFRNGASPQEKES